MLLILLVEAVGCAGGGELAVLVHVHESHGVFAHAWAVVHVDFHHLFPISVSVLDHGLGVHLIHSRLVQHLRVCNLRRVLITQHLGLREILNGIRSLKAFLHGSVSGTHIEVAVGRAAFVVNSTGLGAHRLSDGSRLRILIHI